MIVEIVFTIVPESEPLQSKYFPILVTGCSPFLPSFQLDGISSVEYGKPGFTPAIVYFFVVELYVNFK